MRRFIIIGVGLLLWLLVESAPASVATPIRQATTRPAVEVIISAAPASGTVVTLELPADMLPADGRVPLVDRPGQANWMRGRQ